MVRLIRVVSEYEIHYCHIWHDDRNVVVYKGIVGDKGQKSLFSTRDECWRQIEDHQKSIAITEGYREIPKSHLKTIVIQLKQDDGTLEELLEYRQVAEDCINNELGWYGVGRISGGDIGRGVANIWCEVLDSELGCTTVLFALEQFALEEGVIIASEDAGEYVVLHPHDQSVEFRL